MIVFNFKKVFLATLIVFLGVFLRIFLNKEVGLPNFEATTTLSLLGGSFLGGLYSGLVPLLMIFFSDLYFGNSSVYFFTWSAFVFVGLIGTLARRSSSWFFPQITILGIFSVIFFFLWTNFGWWLTFGMYPMTLSGLLQCYIAGLPFLKNQLISLLLFLPLFAFLFSLFFEKREARLFTGGVKKAEKVVGDEPGL